MDPPGSSSLNTSERGIVRPPLMLPVRSVGDTCAGCMDNVERGRASCEGTVGCARRCTADVEGVRARREENIEQRVRGMHGERRGRAREM